jgi:hypothetical protein
LSAHDTRPTPYADVNALLQELLSAVQTVLGDHFLGMYIHGSLASGDFTPERSDIDFVVVTAGELPAEMLSALEAMHAGITASGSRWATRLEGSYIPQGALRRYDPTHAHHPALRADGTFDVDHHASDWVIQRHAIREQGVVVAGPPPQTLIDPVQPDELRQATLGILREWWSPQLNDPGRLRSSEYQAYAVLTMCRALYTLQHGTVVRKPAAARWAQAAVGERWAGLIERALAWRHDEQRDDLYETLDFIRYTLERSERFEVPTGEARDSCFTC